MQQKKIVSLLRLALIHILEEQKMCCWNQHITRICETQKIGPCNIFLFLYLC